MPEQSHRPKLSFHQANTLCRKFVPIGEKVFQYMDQLEESGFAAFLPSSKFVDSFAENPEELALHRQCIIETAKERLGQPTPIRIYDEDFKQLYFSPFLQRLRAERDRVNGVPVRELGARYPGDSAWRHEVDPCQRRLVQTAATQRDALEARRNAMCEEETRAFEREVAHHASGLGKARCAFDKRGRYGFFAAVMKRDAVRLGFVYDKSRSRANYPVFSKPMTGDWDLCWVLEESRPFLESPIQGRFVPFLEIRSRTLRGSLAKVESGEFLHIRYERIIYGFSTAYWRFRNLDELETVIKAHLCFYSLIAQTIESACQSVL